MGGKEAKMCFAWVSLKDCTNDVPFPEDLETSASLVVTGALLVVTRSY